MKTKKSRISVIQTLGIFIVLAGIILIGVSIFGFSYQKMPHFYNSSYVTSNSTPHYENMHYNATYQFPARARFAYGNILSGAITIILGIVVFKYGQLKKQMAK